MAVIQNDTVFYLLLFWNRIKMKYRGLLDTGQQFSLKRRRAIEINWAPVTNMKKETEKETKDQPLYTETTAELQTYQKAEISPEIKQVFLKVEKKIRGKLIKIW